MWHGEGICEALRIPGVGGVEAREKSYHTHWKLESTVVLGSSSPLRCERCSGAVGQDSKHGKAKVSGVWGEPDTPAERAKGS